MKYGHDTVSLLAAKLDLSEAWLYKIITQQRQPSYKAAKRIETELGIARTLWCYDPSPHSKSVIKTAVTNWRILNGLLGKRPGIEI